MTKIKEISLGLIFILISFLSWYFLYLFFYAGCQNFRIGVLLISFLVIFGAFYSIFVFLVRSKKILLPVLFLISIPPIFIFGYNHHLGGTSLFFFILIIFNFWLMARERDLYALMIRKMWLLRKALPLFFLGLSLMVAVIFYFSPQSIFKLAIPRSLYDFSFSLVESLISSRLPAFNEEMTVDEYLSLQYFITKAKGEFPQRNNQFNIFQIFQDPKLSKLKEKELEKEITRRLSQIPHGTLKEERKNLSKFLGVELRGNENLKDILYFWINSQLLIVTKPYEEYISLGFVFITFLALQTLGLPYKWVAGLVGWIFLELLLLFRLIKRERETVERETITL